MSAPRAPANRAEVVEVMDTALGRMPLECTLRHRVIALLAALEAAGVRLVPAEATDRDLEDCCERRGLWIEDMRWLRRQIIAASPYAPEGRR